MSEEAKALRDLKFWIAMFAIAFTIWVGIFSGAMWRITTEVHAFNECSRVADKDFKTCYDMAKKQ